MTVILRSHHSALQRAPVVLRSCGAVILQQKYILLSLLHEGHNIADVPEQLLQVLVPDVDTGQHRPQLGHQPQQVHGAVQAGEELARAGLEDVRVLDPLELVQQLVAEGTVEVVPETPTHFLHLPGPGVFLVVGDIISYQVIN